MCRSFPLCGGRARATFPRPRSWLGVEGAPGAPLCARAWCPQGTQLEELEAAGKNHKRFLSQEATLQE